MNRILIIQLSRIGDIIRTFPLISGLKQSHPQSTVSLLCVDEFSDIMAPFSFPDQILTLPAQTVHRLQSMNQADPDFIQSCLSETNIEQPVDLLINCDHEIGVAMLAEKINCPDKRGRIYHPAIPFYIPDVWGKYLFAFTQNRLHNFYNMAEMYLKMANPDLQGQTCQPFLTPDEADRQSALNELKTHGYNGGKLVFIQLGSSSGLRSWQPSKFSRLALGLISDENFEIAFIGSPAETTLANQVLKEIGLPVINLVGKTSLKALPYILSWGDLLITNDTGPMHIANLVNIPILVIYLSTGYFPEAAPYNDGHFLIHPNLSCYPCIPGETCDPMICKDTITIEMVQTISTDIIKRAIPDFWDFKQVGIYKTFFSSDGSLGFIPKSKQITEHYLTGYLFKIVCRAMFSSHAEYLLFDDLPESLRAHPRLAELLKNVETELDSIIIDIQNGKTLLQKINHQFGSPTADQEIVNILFGQFKEIENNFSQHQDSLLRLYHLLDMMVVDQDNAQQMIRQIFEKYLQREEQLLKAREALDFFSQAILSDQTI